MNNKQRCDCCKKWVNIDGDLFLLDHDESGEYSVCEKCSEKWKKTIPHEIITRLEETNTEITIKNIIKESRYLLSIILDGGSSYNDDQDQGEGIKKECQKFLKSFGNL